jgi:hypothetical protein
MSLGNNKMVMYPEKVQYFINKTVIITITLNYYEDNKATLIQLLYKGWGRGL